MDVMLEAAERCVSSGSAGRFRIIHAMLTNPQQIERMKSLPVVLDTQPAFLNKWATRCAETVGAHRARWFLPYRSYLDAGLIVTAGSDAPVDTFDPFTGIQCLVTRQDKERLPESGFFPEERVSAFEAVSLYTRLAAYSCREEDRKGVLAPGMLADMAVLDRDIFAIDPYEIHNAGVLKTVLGGRTVFSKT
jgi:predicted amidohydrolase YtcJ